MKESNFKFELHFLTKYNNRVHDSNQWRIEKEKQYICKLFKGSTDYGIKKEVCT